MLYGKETSGIEARRFSGDPLAVYAQLVGVPERRYPELDEFPPDLLLPMEAIGSFFDNVVRTSQDGKERYQTIQWDEQHQIFEPNRSVVEVGRFGVIVRPPKEFFGRKDLLMYHTHPLFKPDPSLSGDFSQVDVAELRSNPRLAYIWGVGSEVGGVFVFQTRQSAALPFSSTARFYGELLLEFFVRPYSILSNYQDENFLMDPDDTTIGMIRRQSLSIDHKVDYLEARGYGCYLWKPDEQKPERGLYLRRVGV